MAVHFLCWLSSSAPAGIGGLILTLFVSLSGLPFSSLPTHLCFSSSQTGSGKALHGWKALLLPTHWPLTWLHQVSHLQARGGHPGGIGSHAHGDPVAGGKEAQEGSETETERAPRSNHYPSLVVGAIADAACPGESSGSAAARPVPSPSPSAHLGPSVRADGDSSSCGQQEQKARGAWDH